MKTLSVYKAEEQLITVISKPRVRVRIHKCSVMMVFRKARHATEMGVKGMVVYVACRKNAVAAGERRRRNKLVSQIEQVTAS